MVTSAAGLRREGCDGGCFRKGAMQRLRRWGGVQAQEKAAHVFGAVRALSAMAMMRIKSMCRKTVDSDVNGQSNDSAAIRGIAFRPDNTAKSGFHVLRTRPIQETLKGERLDGSKGCV